MTANLTHRLDAALAAADRGWHVFPLVPGTKRPAVDSWERRATTDAARIRAAWGAGPFGVGIACGPSGLIVLDLDQPKRGTHAPKAWRRPGIACGHDVLAARCAEEGKPWPPCTYTVATQSGGQHLYYRQPGDARLRSTVDGLGWCIDTRGHGGYVVAAGTLLTHGTYTVLENAPVVELPGWLANSLTARTTADLATPNPIELRTGRVTAYVDAAIVTQVAHVRGAVQGKRNFTLYMAAQNLGQLVAGGMVDASLVHHVLVTAAEPHLAAGAYTRREAIDTIRSGLRAGGRRPHRLSRKGAS